MTEEQKAEHKMSYIGSKIPGYGWKCSCGEAEGTGIGEDHPFAEKFDRTWWAREHLVQVGAAHFDAGYRFRLGKPKRPLRGRVRPVAAQTVRDDT